MKQIIFILTAILSIFTNNILAGNRFMQFKSHQISTTDGLPSNTIRTIVQDEYGFIWVGGTNGLARYDGYRFVNLNNSRNQLNESAQQHIGSIYADRYNHTLWISTSTYSNGCFDLKRGKFIDYTGNNDCEKEFRKKLSVKEGMWLYNNTDGLRHIICKNGIYKAFDYNTNNKKIPTNNIRGLDKANNNTIWAATDKGVIMIRNNGKVKLLNRNIDFIGITTYKDKAAAFSKKDQTAYIYNKEGLLLKKAVLASPLGRIGSIKGSIIWKGKWIIFTNDESYTLDISTGVFSKEAETQIPEGTRQGDIDGLQFVGNKSGNLWIFPEEGSIRKLKLIDNLQCTNEKNGIFKIAKDKKGVFYIATYGGGLFRYEYNKNLLTHYTAEDEHSLFASDFLLDIIIDKSGCIWISSEASGISILRPIDDINYIYELIDNRKKGDWTNYVRNIFRNQNGEINVSSYNNKLYKYRNGKFVFIRQTKATIYGHFIDHNGNEWMATRGDGIYINNKKMTIIANGHRMEGSDFYDIAEDNKGYIWIASWGKGLYRTKYTGGKNLNVEIFLNREDNESRIHDIEIDKAGNLWLATFNGLYHINTNKKHISDKDFECYNTANSMFPTNEIICLKHTEHGLNGTLWVGTMGSGLFACKFSQDFKHISYKSITKHEGLTNDNVKAITQDKYKYIWASTDEGLSRIDQKDYYVKKFILSENVQSNSFAENSVTTLPNGKLAFGSRYGIAIINPRDEHKRKYATPPHNVIISDLQINGISIFDKENTQLLDSALNITKKLNLKHSQNTISIYFSDFNFKELPSQLYKFYLEGADNTWRHITSESHTEYANLEPGKYVFHVKALDNNTWSNETKLIIYIGQPWYNTFWAWLFYISIMIIIGYYLYNNTREKMRLHQQMELEKELNEFRTNFFTHITHEFRTPLAIIHNAVEKIAKSGTANRQNLQTAQRGVRRMLKMVNQFMEFRKADTGNIKLNVESGDIIAFARDIYQDLWSMAKQKGINYIFTPFDKRYDMLFDKQQMETMIYNLISNAVKYTSDKGTVEMRIKKDEDRQELIIEVEDNGEGIEKEQQKNLFTPFMHGYVSKGGMGIGLYTARKAARRHYGDLTFRPAELQGSIFTISIPLDEDSYQTEDYSTRKAITENKNTDEKSLQMIKEMSPEALNNQTVAIIEDDVDMMGQIKEEVATFFNTRCYSNGREGFEGIKAHRPDLILCDVMLPDMDGYEIVDMLKKDPESKQIPIIMLTALDDESHQIKGYKVGADDYMVKPCNFHLLMARIIQLIKWNSNVTKTEDMKNDSSDDCTVKNDGETIFTNKADKIFKENVDIIISQHISNSDFNIDTLAQTLCMGRTKFYGKMKELYGISPNRYLMNRRMNRAAELIVEGKHTISEISYMVGIEHSSYFNKCFKTYFGVPPSKYKG